MDKPVKPASNADLTLVITRLFDAPRERVFDAWLDPKQISKWIGPRTVRAEAQILEPKVGGRYRIHMRREDGAEGPIVGGVYREIRRPEKLVFTWMWDTAHPMGHEGHETIITLTFKGVGAKTEMTLHQEVFDSTASRDSHNQGWTVSFEKLAELLS